MPTFVPIRDEEAPLTEQDESKLAHHRHWDSFVIGRENSGRRKIQEEQLKRGWEKGSVGWGVVGRTLGSSEKDQGAQIVRRIEDPNKKLVRNENGLWVKQTNCDEKIREDERKRMRPNTTEHVKEAPDREPSRRRREYASSSKSEDDCKRRYQSDNDFDDRVAYHDSRRERYGHDHGRQHDKGKYRRPSPEPRESTQVIKTQDLPQAAIKKVVAPEIEEAPVDFQFSACQLVDRVLEIFNSDAPTPARRAALSDCFDNVQVATLTGERRISIVGEAAINAITNASERIERAEPKLRVFMEAGTDHDDNQQQVMQHEPTLCLDAYAAGETPGLAAIVKGKPAPTIVLWRVEKNKITHAWIAPDKDNFAQDWASVTEERFLDSKAMNLTNTVLASELPQDCQYWDFHFTTIQTYSILSRRLIVKDATNKTKK